MSGAVISNQIVGWIFSNHERMDPHEKEKFFRMLKFEEEKALRTISANLPGWVQIAAIELNISVPEIKDFKGESEELAKAFKKRFANELAAIAA